MNRNNTLNEDQSNDEYINISYLFNTFSRNKKLIISFLFIFLLLSSVFTFFFRKKTWEGKFEIVLGADVSNQKDNTLQQLVLGGMDTKSALNTEVGILKSPSVLLPVFDFVKNEYKLQFPNKKELIFSEWKENNLNIELQKNTSILTIKYLDQNKELLIPVLERISNEYKEYSGKNKRRNLNLAKEYISNQIQKYRVKSSNSLKIAQEFAINQDLITINQNMEKSSIESDLELDEKDIELTPSFLKTNTGIEGVRVRAANRIRNIDNQIKKIKSLNDDVKEIQYLGSTISGLIATGLPKKLEGLESRLVDLRAKYTEEDVQIKRTIEKRKLLINLLKERAIGYLGAQRIQQEALMESATRPKGVILKYKELMREAGRDEITLINLENNLRTISLEEARLEKPWELINEPTLEKDPAGISDKKFIFFGTFLGFLIGCIVSYIKEKNSDVCYEDKIICNLFDSSVLTKINLKSQDFEYNSKQVVFKEIFKYNTDNKFAFIFPSSGYEDLINQLKTIFNELKYFNIEDNFSEINEDSKIILFAIVGQITRKEIKETLNRLNIQRKNLYSLILIE